MTWTAETLSTLATGYWQSQALITAATHKLFHALPGTPAEIARQLQCDPRLTTMLLESLTAMGLLTRTRDTFTLDSSAAQYLGPAAPYPLEPALLLNRDMYALWAHLPTTLKTGQPALPPTSHLGADPARTRAFVLGMHSRGRALLPPVATALDLTGVHTLLDIGAGPATLTRLLLDRQPSLTATAVDLPAITAVAQELTAAHPTSTRLTHLAADYLTDTLPQGFDAAVYCGALHQHAPAQAPAILTKLLSSLHPGGKLFLIDLMLADNRTTPAFSALFGLNMALLSPVAHIHSPAEITSHLHSLNATSITHHPIEGGIYHLITAQAPQPRMQCGAS